MNPFPAPWQELSAEVIRDFLASAGDEPLVWEAKGGGVEPKSKTIVKALCGFANSEAGGCLVLGADPSPGGGWDVKGVPIRSTEPELWIRQIAGAGLRPLPPLHVHAWPEGAGHLLVIRAEPIAGVCLTSDGVAYQRVSGETIPVKDPSILAGLYRRGEVARAGAEKRARMLLESSFDAQPLGRIDHGAEVRVGLALAAMRTELEIGARLFSRSFEDALVRIAGSTVGVPASRPIEAPLGSSDVSMSADRVSFSRRTAALGGHPESYAVVATWSGTLFAAWAMHGSDEQLIASAVSRRLAPLWSGAIEVLEQLGASGDVFVAILTAGDARGTTHEDCVTTIRQPVCRWTTLRPPDEAELQSVQRELLRHRGKKTFEE
jgi:hypothetical protein